VIEAGLRSYLREYAPYLTLLDPRVTSGSPAAAKEVAQCLLDQHRDLIGLFISGNGLDGAISAVQQSGRSDGLAVVGFGTLEAVRTALINGTMSLAITIPLRRIAGEAISEMLRYIDSSSTTHCFTRLVSFELNTHDESI